MSSSARPSTRLHPGSPFAWQQPTRTAGAARRADVARAELASHAGLLYRLGFSEADAAARLVARIAWEFDPARGAHRRPDALSDQAIAKLVAETYARKPG